MTDQDLEQALRGALRPRDPPSELIEQVMARIGPSAQQWPAELSAAAAASAARATSKGARPARHWLPAAAAAAALAALGATQWARLQHQHQHQLQVRAQLLQGLTIASASLREARDAVLQSEDSAP